MTEITAKDVAALAGVSRSAVSRTFTPRASVAPETRRRVLEAAERLGYRPNALASSLAKGRSDLVALVANSQPDLREPYLFHALNAALQGIGRQLVTVSLDNADRGTESLADLIRFPLETAVVMADSVDAATIAPYCTLRPPIMLNGRAGEADCDLVRLDEAAGIGQALGWLSQRGIHRLWYVAGRRTATAHASRRLAFLEALAKYPMLLVDEDIGDFSYESGAEAWRRLAARGDRPDALIAANDAMAMGALDAAREAGRGSDVTVIGFDNVPQSNWAPYRFPTVEQPIAGIVDAVCDILRLRADEPGSPPIERVVQTRFIPR
ncbi:LacI family DNA-binding transcriptional regulator [Prosthecomicrobium sp. N25]|uniref:LacI family DNA-binding transcriptional regulator n=1 Tax=Prosthecomicrobium sp. N25 TaxID=3129254 RepID=UPI003077C015